MSSKPDERRSREYSGRRRLQARAQERRTTAQRLGDWIALRAAQESSSRVHLGMVRHLGGDQQRPDVHQAVRPVPFTLLTTVVSLEAIFLTLFVLASEDRLTQDAERRGQLDLQVDLLAEQEMTVLRMLAKYVSTWICGRRSRRKIPRPREAHRRQSTRRAAGEL